MPRKPSVKEESEESPAADEAADLLARLDVAIRLREYHHNAIWEEQKHFTWMLSAVLTAELLVLTSDHVRSAGQAFLGVAFGLLGTAVAITAMRVQRREGEYMRNTQIEFVRCYNKFFELPVDVRIAEQGPANRPIIALVGVLLSGKGGIRDHFQALLLFFTAMFGALVIYALVAWQGVCC